MKKGLLLNPYPNIDSAFITVSSKQKKILLFLGLFLFLSLIINWKASLLVLVSLLTIYYTIDLVFIFFLIIRSFLIKSEIKVSKSSMHSNLIWPKYTVLCPLYRESAVIGQFVKAMERLDYPKDKLEIMLLLEKDDQQTIDIAYNFNLPSYFKIVVVPESLPKTKPKACNYGLARANGEFVVIFDAEDIPQKDQLKKAVLGFNQVDNNFICLQAKLNYYNPNQNLLTKLFTLEYSQWFDLILPGLQSINGPIPLGGTSNHFKTALVKRIGGWDGYNVTEDADLGMRIFKQGYKTAILDSTTMEEANSDVKNWFKQRSRWIKGYIQTYLVHTRTEQKINKNADRLHLITFHLIIGFKTLTILINPLMWLLTAIYFIFRSQSGAFIESLFITPIFYMAVFCFIFGNFLTIYYLMIGAAKRHYWSFIIYAIISPIYWLMMALAGIYAVIELIKNPFYWQKTIHGLHLDKKEYQLATDILLSPTN